MSSICRNYFYGSNGGPLHQSSLYWSKQIKKYTTMDYVVQSDKNGKDFKHNLNGVWNPENSRKSKFPSSLHMHMLFCISIPNFK